MKKNWLLYLLIAVLIIWNITLTNKVNSFNSTQNVENHYEVSGFSTDFTKVIDNAKDSIITISSSKAISSGFVYKQDNNDVYIVTTYHGVSDDGVINLVFDSGYTTQAEMVGYDAYLDLAVLKVVTPYTIPFLKIGNSDLLKSGEFLLSIGTPSSIEHRGSSELLMVSSPLRTVNNVVKANDITLEYYLDAIQVTGNVSYGYSGSPLLNANGEIVGIITMSSKDNSSEVFATTINEAKIAIDRIIAGQDYHKVQLGIAGCFVNNMPLYEKGNNNIPLDINYGYLVSNVKISTLSYIAGVKNGDVILSINGIKINSLTDLLSITYENTKSFTYEIYRNGETLSFVGTIND